MRTLVVNIVKMVMTSARSKMFDKVKRSDMKVEYYWEQDLRDGPWDHL